MTVTGGGDIVDMPDPGNCVWLTYYASDGEFESVDVLRFDVATNWIIIDDIVIETDPVAPVPEPATILLLGAGLACFAGFRRRVKK